MLRKGHSEEQIVRVLRQAEAGQKVIESFRAMVASQQAFYSWKQRYAGLGLSELRELRRLREENRKLNHVRWTELQDSCCFHLISLELVRRSGGRRW